jgi:SAM-dependent methyltransferase
VIGRLKAMMRSRGKAAFIASLAPNARVLDIGCGNNSPYMTKKLLPGCHYTGVDVGDYNQKRPNVADEYVVCDPQHFAKAIEALPKNYDAVISSHNLEHCNDRYQTLSAMTKSLAQLGMLYLSFPSEQTTEFPSRDGTLNYFDDSTHKSNPPSLATVMDVLQSSDMDVDFCSSQYQPIIYRIMGAIVEPISRSRKKVMLGTWEYYGFETVLWATKRRPE